MSCNRASVMKLVNIFIRASVSKCRICCQTRMTDLQNHEAIQCSIACIHWATKQFVCCRIAFTIFIRENNMTGDQFRNKLEILTRFLKAIYNDILHHRRRWWFYFLSVSHDSIYTSQQVLLIQVFPAHMHTRELRKIIGNAMTFWWTKYHLISLCRKCIFPYSTVVHRFSLNPFFVHLAFMCLFV